MERALGRSNEPNSGVASGVCRRSKWARTHSAHKAGFIEQCGEGTELMEMERQMEATTKEEHRLEIPIPYTTLRPTHTHSGDKPAGHQLAVSIHFNSPRFINTVGLYS
ncbi:hypothetical protein J6590_066687 [Homalodisca vitripennis]|nr:hypothetical protein J6590_066687 [Homalodisca vitripennis]